MGPILGSRKMLPQFEQSTIKLNDKKNYALMTTHFYDTWKYIVFINNMVRIWNKLFMICIVVIFIIFFFSLGSFSGHKFFGYNDLFRGGFRIIRDSSTLLPLITSVKGKRRNG